ncbi:MAG: hypothetical protein Q9159_000877 [Coniocarpon cinnabarinum]
MSKPSAAPSTTSNTKLPAAGFTSSAFASTVIAVATGVYAWFEFPATSDPTPIETTTAIAADESTMAEIKQGWPGNLTPEQEAKLKEFWLALGQVTGIVKDARTSSPPRDAAPATAEADTTPKKSGKRFGLFGSRREHHDEHGAAGGKDSAGAGETGSGEDKYGQTKQFKQALQDLTPEELHRTIWSFTKGDNPDALLLRFLRARKWNVQNALVMLVSTVHWRVKDVKMDTELIPRGEAWFADKEKNGTGHEKQLGKDFMAQIRMGKSFIHGTDKEGRPMCFVRVRLHKSGDQSEEALEKFTIYTIETTRMMLSEQVDTAGIIFDMTDFSLSNMDYTPVKFMIKIFEANYPESLGHICVHHAPWVFSSVWNIIKGWLDPVVASKVHFTKDIHELSHFVDRNKIPKELGGGEEFKYEYVEPVEGENAEIERARTDGRLEKLEEERRGLVKEFEERTIEWCRGSASSTAHNAHTASEIASTDAKDDTALSNGLANTSLNNTLNDATTQQSTETQSTAMQQSTTTKDLPTRRRELIEALKSNYWDMDPFVRARTLYDRTGVIGPKGQVNMYPQSASSQNVASNDQGGVD